MKKNKHLVVIIVAVIITVVFYSTNKNIKTQNEKAIASAVMEIPCHFNFILDCIFIGSDGQIRIMSRGAFDD